MRVKLRAKETPKITIDGSFVHLKDTVKILPDEVNMQQLLFCIRQGILI